MSTPEPPDAPAANRRAPTRELLEANHSFPCEYMIKAFGPARDEFRSGVTAAIEAAVGARAAFSERASSGGRKICITVRLKAQTVDEVERAYERLYEVSELQMIL